MIEQFTNYMSQIIDLTYGFKPELKVEEPYVGTIQIWISGTPTERALIMGKEAKSIQALSRLACTYARRNNCFVYIYVRPREEV